MLNPAANIELSLEEVLAAVFIEGVHVVRPCGLRPYDREAAVRTGLSELLLLPLHSSRAGSCTTRTTYPTFPPALIYQIVLQSRRRSLLGRHT